MASKQSGASAIEFALILPLILLMIDGMIEISILMYDQAIILNASREAARAGIVVKSPKLLDSEITTIARNYSNAYLISFGAPEAVQVTVLQSNPAAYQTPLMVSVVYTYSSLLGGNFLSALQMPLTLTAATTLMNE